MNRRDLIAALAAHELRPDQMPTGNQMGLVQQFSKLYEKRGLLLPGAADGRVAPALRLCCPNGEACWKAARDRRRNVNKGGITLPWVGPAYRSGGVLVLGMNFDDAEGIAMSFRLAHWERDALARGCKLMNYDVDGYRGSSFAYRSTRSAALLTDLINGGPVYDRIDPPELADVLDQIVRIQTVKCSPRNDAWSKPTTAMLTRCPPLLLLDELAVAQPRFIVAFSAVVRRAIGGLPSFTPVSRGSQYGVGKLVIGDLSPTVFMLAHPRSSSWPASHGALISYLRRHRKVLASEHR